MDRASLDLLARLDQPDRLAILANLASGARTARMEHLDRAAHLEPPDHLDTQENKDNPVSAVRTAIPDSRVGMAARATVATTDLLDPRAWLDLAGHSETTDHPDLKETREKGESVVMADP